jgi:MoaA/NifB/PqqE/SkfB family radical SAM enzyme
MCWIKERAEALPQLRCIEVNGDWEAFIAFVHERPWNRPNTSEGVTKMRLLNMINPRQLIQIARKRSLSPWELVSNFVKYNWLARLRRTPFLPKALLIYIDYRCNARCVMCGIWKPHEFSDARTELSPAELERILSDRLFAELEYVNINGGEPTLRPDLVDAARAIIAALPHLKHLSMNSNGLLTERLATNVKEILAVCRPKNIDFSLTISFHGVGQLHDNIYRVPGASGRIERTLEALKALDDPGFALALNCVITNANADRLFELLEWCEQRNIHINFILGEVRDRFFNQDTIDQTTLQDAGKKESIAFFRHLAQKLAFTNPNAFRYHRLANMLEYGEKRDMACHYAMGGLILGSHGNLYYCSHSKEIGNCRERSAYEIYFSEENLQYRDQGLMKSECLYCPPNSLTRFQIQKDISKYLRFLTSVR